jgi:SOS regulatory protein LexA
LTIEVFFDTLKVYISQYMSQPITSRQKQLLDFVQGYTEKKGISPSLEEMASALKLSSLSSIHYHLARLEEKGLISRSAGNYRSIRITDESDTVTEIPLVGAIAAGQPIEAIEEREKISVPKSMLSGSGDHFALQVSGDSMVGDGIFNRDIVVIRKQEYANDGDTIVAIINGNEATLKRLYREKDGFRLQPANPNIEPIFTKELLVQGKVMSILRNVDNELIATPIEKKTKNYIRSDEYINEESLRILSDAILQFKEENGVKYKSNELFGLAILKELFAYILAKQGLDISMRKEVFDNLDIQITLNAEDKKELDRIFSNFNSLTNTEDVLGHVYQSIQSREERKDSGQYYTPNKVVDFIIENIDVKFNNDGSLKILDPACGSGQFLIRAYEKLLEQYRKLGVADNVAHKKIVEEHLFGIDVDPVACMLARANLVLKNPFVSVKPNIFVQNFLKKDFGLIDPDPFTDVYNTFDFVIGNPPWGASLTREDKKYFAKYYSIGEVGLNTFTLFMERSLDFLKEKGRLGFLIPEAYLKIKVHQPSRQQLLRSGEIKLLAISGDIFKKVYAPALVLIFEETKKINKDHQILIKEGVFNGEVKESKIPQSLFNSTPDNIFNIHFSDLSTKIIQQIEGLDNKYLKDHTLFILGIVTGNNKKHLVSKKLTKDHSPIIVGKDLRKFKIDFGGNYFVYDKAVLQQVAPRDYYASPEKLIYKFIGKNLTFAYDNEKRFSLNNANAIVPNIPNLKMKYILGVLNSDLMQFYYTKSFFTVRVLRSNLERLPIYNATKSQQEKVIKLVEKIEKAEESEYEKSLRDLNEYIYELYGLSDEQREYAEEELAAS